MVRAQRHPQVGLKLLWVVRVHAVPSPAKTNKQQQMLQSLCQCLCELAMQDSLYSDSFYLSAAEIFFQH